MNAHLRRSAAAAAVLLAPLFCGVLLAAGPAAADGAPRVPVSVPHIIPQPNSGTPPKHAGDLGSGTQFLVFAGIVVSTGVIVLLVRRESHRKLAQRDRRRDSAEDPESAESAESG